MRGREGGIVRLGVGGERRREEVRERREREREREYGNRESH